MPGNRSDRQRRVECRAKSVFAIERTALGGQVYPSAYVLYLTSGYVALPGRCAWEALKRFARFFRPVYRKGPGGWLIGSNEILHPKAAEAVGAQIEVTNGFVVFGAGSLD